LSTRAGTDRFLIRRAREAEAADLSQLAFRAKASHGYDQAFMDACRAEMTISPADFATRIFWVAETRDGGLLGFAGLWPVENDVAEVDPVYVEPAMQGLGTGQALWTQLEQQACAWGARKIGLDSDPHATGFYERMGCRIVGEAPSGSIPGRMLPRMEKRIA
jgi:N-acetylglutamate synthase-like GNAT family acetyltransferase